MRVAKIDDLIVGVTSLLVTVNGLTAFRRRGQQNWLLPSAGINPWNFLIQDLGFVLEPEGVLRWDVYSGPITTQIGTDFRTLDWTPFSFALRQDHPRKKIQLCVAGDPIGTINRRL